MAFEHRTQLTSKAGDPLPTAEAINTAKDAAWNLCLRRIREESWPPSPLAHAMLDQTVLVALAILEVLCPTVAVERLARCLGIGEAASAEARLRAARASPLWPLPPAGGEHQVAP